MHVPLPPLLPPSLPLTFLATLSPPRSHTRPRATSAAAPPYGRSRLGGKPAAADGPNAGVGGEGSHSSVRPNVWESGGEDESICNILPTLQYAQFTLATRSTDP